MIEVKLTDGAVKVGGDFTNALAFVQRQAGRDFDWETKIWSVPQTIKEFMARCSFPTEVVVGDGSNRYSDGNHVTRYGNVYTSEEWDTNRSVWRAEKEVGDSYEAGYEASRKQFQADLQGLDVSAAGIRMLEAHLWDFEDAEGYRLKFSSRARRDEVFAIIETRRERDLVLYEAEEDEISARREAIFESAGVL